jgi:hypothetical protein
MHINVLTFCVKVACLLVVTAALLKATCGSEVAEKLMLMSDSRRQQKPDPAL